MIKHWISTMPASKYFINSKEEEGETVFQWIGDGEKKGRCIYYSGCMVNGHCIKVGDDVLVKGENETALVGRLAALLENASENPRRAKILWYYTYNELPKKTKLAMKEEPLKNELYYILTDDKAVARNEEEIDADTLYQKTNLAVIQHSFSSQLKQEKYIIRYALDYTFSLVAACCSCTVSNSLHLDDCFSEHLLQNQRDLRSRKLSHKPTGSEKETKSGKENKNKAANQSKPRLKQEAPKVNTPKIKSKRGLDSNSHIESDPKTEDIVINKKRKTRQSSSDFTDCMTPRVSHKNGEKDKKQVALKKRKLKGSITQAEEPSTVHTTSPSHSRLRQFDAAEALEMVMNDDVEEETFASDDAESDDDNKSYMSEISIERICRNSPMVKLTAVQENELKTIVNGIPQNASPLSSSTIKKLNMNQSSNKLENQSISGKENTKLTELRKGKNSVECENNITPKIQHLRTCDENFVLRSSSRVKARSSPVTNNGHHSTCKGKKYKVPIDCLADSDNDASLPSESEASIDESDDEVIIKYVNRQAKKRNKKAVDQVKGNLNSSKITKTPAKQSRTPKKKLMTPVIANRQTPCQTPKSPLENARQRLHVSAIPETLPCREAEFQDIYTFIEGKLSSQTGGCLYISGVPGTGKTATVHEAMRCIMDESDDGLLPQFSYIEINGMKLTEPNQTYVTFLKELTGQKATPDHAAAILEKRFTSSSPKKEAVVLIVDELDLLWTRKQNVMYNMFEWPTRRNSKLVVIAIANTMDLPERIMMNRVSSRLGLTRTTFQPYTFKQLEEIVISRIKGIKAFEEDALQLVARKVAAVSGDARRCLDICRRAVEIAELTLLGSHKKKMKGVVGMKHVQEALADMFSSPKIVAMRNLALLESFYLRAVISEFRRSGLEEALFIEVYKQLSEICRIEGTARPPTMSEAFQICQALGSSRIILIEPGHKDIHSRLRLNVSQDDVMFALKGRQKVF